MRHQIIWKARGICGTKEKRRSAVEHCRKIWEEPNQQREGKIF